MSAAPLTSTYRLQLHARFGFGDARAIVPYLARLGVSHLYLSPVLAARPGSMHGYDVIDPRASNPELGGDDGFRALADAAHEHGMGMLVDIVPNHMGVGPSNPFWMDVLRRGRASRFADVFDIDWNVPGREGILVLPVLGDELATVIARDELRISRESGELRVTYFEHEWPVAAESEPLAERAMSAEGEERRALVAQLIEQQHWRPVHWRRAAREINYRRFFDVGELAALRVEDPGVFELTHGWILDRLGEGLIDGLRVDHIDGLRDPQGYLERLRAAVDARRPGEALPILVEKILSTDETLRGTWPTDGTTGYEFLNLVESVFIDPAGFAAIESAYRRLLRVSERVGFPEVAARGKELVLRRAFDADLRRIVRQLAPAARAIAPRIPLAMLHEAVLQLAIWLPVYRTYVRPVPNGDVIALDATADDVRWIGDALARARRGGGDRFALQFVADVLRGEWPGKADVPPRARRAAIEFALRFQQTSGPATAKGIEDTALYRWFPLASRNDVGGDPASPLEESVARLHAGNAERAARWPRQLLAVDTHDAKRSADVRARIDALSQISGEWIATVTRWRRRHAPLRALVARRAAPDANTEYLLYQTLVGLWPVGGLPSAEAREGLASRVTEYLRKAAREAKAQTSWTDSDAAFEQALEGFTAALVDGEAGAPFRAELTTLVERVARAGYWTALARTVLQLVSPGVPDTYQGGELWSYALVDPDNRRPVDFAEREAAVESPIDVPSAMASVDDGRIKLHVLGTLLRARRAEPALFATGAYEPLVTAGAHADQVVALARTAGEHGGIAIVSRLPLMLRPDGSPPVGEATWRDTVVRLPGTARSGTFVEILTGATVEAEADGTIRVGRVLGTLPVAWLRW